jgi:hypothetical protein
VKSRIAILAHLRFAVGLLGEALTVPRTATRHLVDAVERALQPARTGIPARP